jgi:ABC-type sugar transport system substrate-binding protein
MRPHRAWYAVTCALGALLFLVGCSTDSGAGASGSTAQPSATGSGSTGSDSSWMPSLGKISTADYKPNLTAQNTHITIGYDHIGNAIAFQQEVLAGVKAAAAQVPGLKLKVLVNNYSASQAVQDIRQFINEKVNAVILYQCDVATNAVIANLLKAADIPLVTMDCTAPGAADMGGNNTIAGSIGGAALATEYSKKHWSASNTAYVYVQDSAAGQPNVLRMDGYKDGFLKGVPNFPTSHMFTIDTDGTEEGTLPKAKTWLAAHPSFTHLLWGTISDGPGQAVYQALKGDPYNRFSTSVIESQGCDSSAQQLLRAHDPVFLGSVDYQPGLYGFYSISMALDLMNHDPVPDFYWVHHQMCTSSNVNELYPNGNVKYPWNK